MTTVAQKHIALIGGGGVIGRVLRSGSAHQYAVLDRASPDDIPYGRWIRAEISQNSLRQVLAGCDAVIYLATGVPDWEGLANVDMFGFRDVCELAIKQGITKIIYTSSNHAVGMVEREWHRGYQGAPYPVDGPCRPDSPYGVAKVFAESLCRMYAEQGLLRTSCVRIGTMRAVDDLALAAKETYFDYIPGGETEVMKRLEKTWLFHADAVALFEEELESDDDFRLRYGFSDNPEPYWSKGVYRWNRM